MITKCSWDLFWLLGLGMLKPSWSVTGFSVRVFSMRPLRRAAAFSPSLFHHIVSTGLCLLLQDPKYHRNSRAAPFWPFLVSRNLGKAHLTFKQGGLSALLTLAMFSGH